MREIARLFTRSQLRSRLTMVAFGEIQRQVVLTVPPPLRVIIYRRLMLRIADRLAHKTRARAIVTGEVVGQVASQTLENLAVINAVTRLPVLRPLVGLDKNEITDEARSLGTYPISIIPDQDCCQLFTPKHPATRATVVETEAAEATLPIDEIVESAIAEAMVEHLSFPSKQP